MQSQLRCKCTKNILEVNSARLENHCIKNNLSYNIVKLAKRFGLEIRNITKANVLNFATSDLELAGLLDKCSLTSFCNEKKLHLYTVGQLLNPSRTKMFTWQ